jgi:citrate synthase
VGHLLEERERPIATEIWRRAEEEASAHVRPG